MIINKISGSHNEYDAIETIKTLRAEIETLEGEPFVELVDARELEGITPEGYGEVKAYYQWLYEKGIVAKAYVVSNSALPEIGKKQVPEFKKINIRVFTDIVEAKCWLLAELQKWKGRQVSP